MQPNALEKDLKGLSPLGENHGDSFETNMLRKWCKSATDVLRNIEASCESASKVLRKCCEHVAKLLRTCCVSFANCCEHVAQALQKCFFFCCAYCCFHGFALIFGYFSELLLVFCSIVCCDMSVCVFCLFFSFVCLLSLRCWCSWEDFPRQTLDP